MEYISDHPPKVSDTLHQAGMSRNSELTPDEADRAKLVTEWLAKKGRNVTENRLREMIMHPTQQGEAKGGTRRKEGKMPATAQRDSLKQSDVAKLAGMRRDGATWDEVSAEAGFILSSTGWREVFNDHGFEKTGIKMGSSQKSKARAWGTAGNSSKATAKKSKPAKAKGKAKAKKRPRRVKATASKE